MCLGDNWGSGVKKKKEIGLKRATSNHHYVANVGSFDGEDDDDKDDDDDLEG